MGRLARVLAEIVESRDAWEARDRRALEGLRVPLRRLLDVVDVPAAGAGAACDEDECPRPVDVRAAVQHCAREMAGAVVGRPAARDDTCRMQGTTRSLPLDTLFQLLANSRKTGMLWVRTGDGESLWFGFRGGDVVFSACEGAGEKRLGKVLCEMGFIDEHRLRMALWTCKDSSQRLGEVLRREELISAEQLALALEQQIHLRFERAFQAADAEYEFHELEAISEDHVRLGVAALILESARRRDETSAEVHAAPSTPDAR